MNNTTTRYEASQRADAVASSRDVAFAAAEGSRLIIDARPTGRFEGKDPEPRPGLRQGRIPNSASLPFSDLLAPDGRLLPANELAQRFGSAGLDKRAVIATCGSGVTAAVLVLALAALGREDVALYDGAFAEWGRVDNDPAQFPIAKGTAS